MQFSFNIFSFNWQLSGMWLSHLVTDQWICVEKIEHACKAYIRNYHSILRTLM